MVSERAYANVCYIKTLYTFLPKECMHMFLLIVLISSDISSNSTNRPYFAMDTEFVLCDTGTESL